MSDNTPSISVIVPTKNRADMLARFLPTLAEQTTNEPYEIIVVDNGSTDSTADVVRGLSSKWPKIRSIIEKEPGAVAACHAGALAATAPLIMFVDDDMLAVPNFIAEHLKKHAANPSSCVLGKVVSAESTHPFERMLAYIFDGGRQTLQAGKPVAVDYWSGNVSLSRSLYLEMGGYDQIFARLGYGKDIDFGNRLLKRGIDLIYASEAITYHHFEERFGTRLKKAYRAGQAYGYVKDNYPDLPVPEIGAGKATLQNKLVEHVCHLAAFALEPFDRGRGVPIKPLAYIYDLGLRTATLRGLVDYEHGRNRISVEANGSKNS